MAKRKTLTSRREKGCKQWFPFNFGDQTIHPDSSLRGTKTSHCLLAWQTRVIIHTATWKWFKNPKLCSMTVSETPSFFNTCTWQQWMERRAWNSDALRTHPPPQPPHAYFWFCYIKVTLLPALYIKTEFLGMLGLNTNAVVFLGSTPVTGTFILKVVLWFTCFVTSYKNWREDWVRCLKCATQLLRCWESMKNLSSCKVLTHSDLPKDAMTINNSQQTAGFQSLANVQIQTAKRGQGPLVLVYSFSRNEAVLIFVYLSFNLAAASALQSKRHLTAEICCDVSEMLIWRRSTAKQKLPSDVIGESFEFSDKREGMFEQEWRRAGGETPS